MLKNPSFEDSFIVASENFDDWNINFNTTRTKVTDATDGTYAVKIQTNRSGASGFFAQLSAATPSNDLTFENGKTYTISFDYKVETGTITELKATLLRDNFYLEDEEIATNLAANGWQTFTYDFTANFSAAHNFDINMMGNTAGAEIIIDNANIYEKIGSTDDDSDGVPNNSDNCPNTPSGESVDTNGCSQSQLDDDNDGVFNNNDNCANTPTGESVDTNGCSQNQTGDDSDNDGVDDANDDCPNTPPGEVVNAQGCSINELADIGPEDIEIKVTGISCPGIDDAGGEINIAFEKDYIYDIRVTGNGRYRQQNDVTLADGAWFFGLKEGTFMVRITTQSFPGWERIFEIEINPPAKFSSGRAQVDDSKKVAKLVVTGSKFYEVTVNNRKHIYRFGDIGSHELSFEINDGINKILAKTDKDCQGIYEEAIMLNAIRIFPNPTVDLVTVLGLTNSDRASVTISGLVGSALKKYTTSIANSSLTISLQSLPQGVYVAHIQSKEQNVQVKIVKK